jgi:hypothetical protein
MTTTAIATEATDTTDTTDTTETTRDNEQTTMDGNARKNQRHAVEPQPATSEPGTAYLPGATLGAFTTNWK